MEKVKGGRPGHVFEAGVVENVGQANIFHHFRDLQKLVEKVENDGLANIFHDLGLQNGLSRGERGQANFFHFFHEFLRKSLES